MKKVQNSVIASACMALAAALLLLIGTTPAVLWSLLSFAVLVNLAMFLAIAMAMAVPSVEKEARRF